MVITTGKQQLSPKKSIKKQKSKGNRQFKKLKSNFKSSDDKSEQKYTKMQKGKQTSFLKQKRGERKFSFKQNFVQGKKRFLRKQENEKADKKSFDKKKRMFAKKYEDNTEHKNEIHNETCEHFEKILERLKLGFDNNEEKDMFMKNVMEQTKDKEIELSCDQKISLILQQLIESSENEEFLIRFMQSFSSKFRDVCTDQYGSYVVESLLVSALKLLQKSNEKSCKRKSKGAKLTSEHTITAEILKFSKFCMDNIDYFLSHIYASHVLRTLIETLSGVKMEESVNRNKRSRNLKRKSNDSLARLSPESSKIEVPKEFISEFEEFYNNIKARKDLIDCCKNARISPILQTLIIALQNRLPSQCQKFIEIFMKNICNSSNEEENVPELLADKVSSPVIEKILIAADDKTQKWIWETYFLNSMHLLVADPIANYVVQIFFHAVHDKQLFQNMFNLTSKYFEDILEKGHIGILVSIAETCSRFNNCQPQFIQAIGKVFQCSESETQSYLAPLIMMLVKYEEFEEKSDKKTNLLFKPISYLGSLLLQHMLKFVKPTKVVNSLLSMKNTLTTIACDEKGSHIIIAFFNSMSVGEKNKEKLIQILQPHFISLACDKYGSFTIESIWTSVSIQKKINIAKILAEEESKLNADKYGRYISKHCALHHFKHERDNWKEMQNNESKKEMQSNESKKEMQSNESKKQKICIEIMD